MSTQEEFKNWCKKNELTKMNRKLESVQSKLEDLGMNNLKELAKLTQQQQNDLIDELGLNDSLAGTITQVHFMKGIMDLQEKYKHVLNENPSDENKNDQSKNEEIKQSFDSTLIEEQPIDIQQLALLQRKELQSLLQNSLNNVEDNIKDIQKKINDKFDEVVANMKAKKKRLIQQTEEWKQNRVTLLQKHLDKTGAKSTNPNTVVVSNIDELINIFSSNVTESENKEKETSFEIVNKLTNTIDIEFKNKNAFDSGSIIDIPSKDIFRYPKITITKTTPVHISDNKLDMILKWNIENDNVVNTDRKLLIKYRESGGNAMDKIFEYESDFDTNGIIYYLGTNFGSEIFKNPSL
eukprot:153862_1